MDEARVWIAFAALVVLALVYSSLGVRGALAPLCAVGTATLWFTTAGCLGVLVPGGWVFYGLCGAGLVYVVWRHAIAKKPLPQLGFGFWFFVAAGLVVLLLLWRAKPMFTSWDEFSLWGTAGKLMKLYGELYTTAPVGWNWTASQTPALMVFGYFFQFLGEGYLEWQTYAACDILQMAMLAAVLAPFEKKHWNVALPVAVIGVLTPFVFNHYATVTKISPVYLDSLADIPMGLVFAGVLACWFGDEVRSAVNMVPFCIGLAMLTLMKDYIGLGLALVAVVLVFVDCLLVRWDEKEALKQRAKRAGIRLGAGLASILAAYQGWSIYLGGVAGMNRADSVGGKQDMGMAQIPIAFFRDLFSREETPFFDEVMWGMRWQFFVNKSTMLGQGVIVVAGILAMLVLAAVLTKEKPRRRRCVLFAVFSTLGFAAYYWLITLSYLYILRPEQALVYESYDRYIYPYYIGWFLCAVLLLGAAAARVALPGLRAAVGKLAVAGLSALLFLRVGQLIPADYTILGVHSEEYDSRREFSGYVQMLRRRLDADGKTFIVSAGDTGIRWFTWCYEMLPWQVDYSFGGGDFLERTKQEDGTTATREISEDEWEEYLQKSGCTTVLIDHADEGFRQKYGGLFGDGMAAYFEEGTVLYTVEDSAGTVALHPMKGEA